MCALLLTGTLAVNHTFAFFFFIHSGAAAVISLKQNKRPISGENPEGKYFTVDLMSRYTTHSSFYRDFLNTVIHCVF